MLEPYPLILIKLAWPVMVMFFIERIIVSRYIRTKEQCEYVRRIKWLHPNMLTSYRYPMGFISVLMVHYGYPVEAVYFFGFWMITDLTDGEIARRCNLSTPKGETLDPLSDKLMYMPPLVYLSSKGFLNPYYVGWFAFFDIIGQFSRLFIKQKAANLFGKAKTFLVVGLLFLTMAELIYGELPHVRIINPLLLICTALALFSAALKIIPNYWYANCLSIMNLVCGLTGIWVLLADKPPIYAFGLVFLGQFLDMFDGRAAERWGSTPRGEVFDDVADGTSFGGTIALMVYYSIGNKPVAAALAVFHFSCTIYRLIRFVIEKRKAGQAGGVEWFSGLPSPAGALISGSACLFITDDLIKGILIAAVALLMVSRVPYAHFSRNIMPKIPKLLSVILLAAYMVAVSHAIKTNYYDAVVGVLFAVSVLYVVSPLFWRRRS